MQTRILLGFALLCAAAVSGQPLEHAVDSYMHDEPTTGPNIECTKENVDQFVTIDFRTQQSCGKSLVRLSEIAAMSVSLRSCLNAPTSIIIHGWKETANSSHIVKIRDAYVNDPVISNVAVVDWKVFSKQPYWFASRCVKPIAERLVNIIKDWQMIGLNLADTILVGHGFGAHIAGITGQLLDGKIGAIVGLDPKMTNFEGSGAGCRIAKGNAKYVEIIHTSSPVGITCAIGDADFYPNGGMVQPECATEFNPVKCSHLKAAEWFADSITTVTGYYATQCINFESYLHDYCNDNPHAFMGGRLMNKTIKGSFFLELRLGK